MTPRERELMASRREVNIRQRRRRHKTMIEKAQELSRREAGYRLQEKRNAEAARRMKALSGHCNWPHPEEPELDAFIQGKPIPVKQCRWCHETKPVSHYEKQRNVCKDCRNEMKRRAA